MATNLLTSESKVLEKTRIALTNAETHAEIKPALADYGMDDAKVAEGKAKYESTLAIWEKNKQEKAESKIASESYKDTLEEFQGLFKRHRNQTQIFFKKKPEILIALGVQGSFPTKYNELFDKSKQFYKGIQDSAAIQTEMARIKITPEVVSECMNKHEALLAARAVYEKELGESQDATKSKNAALLELEEWMEDFYAIAKIALYDKPQLLEVLGIFVRS